MRLTRKEALKKKRMDEMISALGGWYRWNNCLAKLERREKK